MSETASDLSSLVHVRLEAESSDRQYHYRFSMVVTLTADLDELRATLDKVIPRSPWTLYLRENYTAFRDAISGKPADWTAIAAWAQKSGHTGEKKPPIAALTCRKAYERERARRGDQPKRVRAITTVKPAPTPPHGVRMMPQPEAIPVQELGGNEARFPDIRERMRRPWDDPAPAPVPAAADDRVATELDAGRE